MKLLLGSSSDSLGFERLPGYLKSPAFVSETVRSMKLSRSFSESLISIKFPGFGGESPEFIWESIRSMNLLLSLPESLGSV